MASAAPLEGTVSLEATLESTTHSLDGTIEAADASSANVVATTVDGQQVSLEFKPVEVIGKGSFGTVVLARMGNGDQIAIKKVLQDKRFRNRELSIMKTLQHTNVVKLQSFFHSSGSTENEIFLNLVLEYIPETVYRVCRHYAKMKQAIPLIYTKLYMFQLCRSMAYVHSRGVCHRDIKPQNLLVDPHTGVLKVCDFGSAKALVPGEPNVSYICSRYYRAPELIFGATEYTTAIDTWSLGCVFAEMLLSHPLFPGESGVDQLVEIIKILGTPSKMEIRAMNPNYTEFTFPPIKSHPWNKVFRSKTPPEAIDLISSFLVYTPGDRITPFAALAHPFFDELRDPNTRLPSNRPLPELFNFTDDERSSNPALIAAILPRQGMPITRPVLL